MNITQQVAYHWRCGFPSASEVQVVGLGLWLSAVWTEFHPPALSGCMQTLPHGPLACKASHMPTAATLWLGYNHVKI